MTTTKTKTLVAIALVTLAVAGTVAGLVIVSRKNGVGFSDNLYSAIKKALIKQPAVSTNPTTVTAAVCGNGQLEKGEECDDGNKKSGDGCTGCPTGCQTSFNSVNSIFNIDTASAVACTVADDCMTNGYGQEAWTCQSGTCQAAACGDGFCNSCRFSPCAVSAETKNNCSQDCGSPTTPPVTPPTTPSADQCKACAGGCQTETGTTGSDTIGLQGTKIPYGITPRDSNGAQLHFKIAAGKAKLFHITAPACTTTAKQLRFTLGALLGNPASDILVKKVNGNPARVPTRADYDAFYALTGRGSGPYVDCGPNKGDGTCDSTGSFFWKFNGGGSGESVIVYSSYNNFALGAPISLKTTIPNFNQADDYYLYVVNTSATQATDVYVRGYCY